MRIKTDFTSKLKVLIEKREASQASQRGSFNEVIHKTESNYKYRHHAAKSTYKEITLQQANRLAKYAPHIQDASKRHKVPVELICAVILQESGGNPKAVSSAGARGLMQLMPATARRFGVTNSFDPKQNIEGGTKYLRFLLDRFNGDYKLALAGYNAGEANVEKYGNRIPPFAETRNYVPSVLSYADSIHKIIGSTSAPNIADTTPPVPSNFKRV